jgi:hypothetical protein
VSVRGFVLLLLNFLKAVGHVAPLLRQAVKHQPRLQRRRKASGHFALLCFAQTFLGPIGHFADPTLASPQTTFYTSESRISQWACQFCRTQPPHNENGAFVTSDYLGLFADCQKLMERAPRLRARLLLPKCTKACTRMSNGREPGMLPRFICAGVVILLIAGDAAAQPDTSTPQSNLGVPFLPGRQPSSTPEQVERQKAIDRAYDATMHKLPDKKSSADPWGDVRPAKKQQ